MTVIISWLGVLYLAFVMVWAYRICVKNPNMKRLINIEKVFFNLLIVDVAMSGCFGYN